LDINLGISRWDGGSLNTPTNGGFSQQIDILEAFANPDALNPDGIGETFARAVIPPNTIVGNTLTEGALYDSSDTALTRSVFADIDVDTDERLISAETTFITGE
jgi:hypothetical protein